MEMGGGVVFSSMMLPLVTFHWWGHSTQNVKHHCPIVIRTPCWCVTDEKCQFWSNEEDIHGKKCESDLRLSDCLPPRVQQSAPPLVYPWPLQIGRHFAYTDYYRAWYLEQNKTCSRISHQSSPFDVITMPCNINLRHALVTFLNKWALALNRFLTTCTSHLLCTVIRITSHAHYNKLISTAGQSSYCFHGLDNRMPVPATNPLSSTSLEFLLFVPIFRRLHTILKFVLSKVGAGIE